MRRLSRLPGSGCAGACAFQIVLFCVLLFAGAPATAQQWKLAPTNRDSGDLFGHAVSLDGDVAVLGAPNKQCPGGSFCGATMLFRFNGTSWDQEAGPLPDDPEPGDYFGYSVSVSGSLLLVGAPDDDCAAGADCGAAYVFRHVGGGSWLQEAKLVPSSRDVGDNFGFSVSISGNIAVLGAPFKSCAGGSACGATMLFRYNGSTWDQEAGPLPNDPAIEDAFGYSVAVSGETLLVGALGSDCGPGVTECGAAYVFRHLGGGSWLQQTKLVPSNADASDLYGHSVGLDGNVAVLGAPSKECPGGTSCGATMLFRYNGASWEQEAGPLPSDLAQGDEFGYSTSISGDLLVVGAYGKDCPHGGSICGAAYVFRDFGGGSWVQTARLLASDRASGDYFGLSVSASGTMVLAGALGNDCPPDSHCGAGYVFELEDPCGCTTQVSGFGGGDGTPGNPYQICSPLHLDNVRNHLSAHFIQTADIDMSGISFVPIGSNTSRFSGTFMGSRFLIHNLVINHPTMNICGMFGYVGSTGVIDGIRIADESVLAQNIMGGLAGKSEGLISDCFVSATVSAASGGSKAGILVGENAGIVERSASAGSVSAVNRVGGLVGEMLGTSVVRDSSTTATVLTQDGGSVGGLAGMCRVGCTVESSYSGGSVSGSGMASMGGLLGTDEGGTILFSFWDTQTSGLTSSAGGVGKTTSQMQMQSTFDPPWDFVDVWEIDEGNDYPRLRWESEPPPPGPMESSCTNQVDDDCDGFVDCDDADCAGDTACVACSPPDCNNHGTCVSGSCACNSGYAGTACDLCAPNYYNYPACTFCLAATTCSGNGTCNVSGSCNCNSGWSGVDCSVAANTPPAVAPAPHNRPKNRYISFNPNSGASVVAFRVQKTTAPTGSCWVQTPVQSGNDQYTATCDATPVFRVWDELVVHVGDCEIVPVADYQIAATADGIVFTSPLEVSTILLPSLNAKLWGDTVGVNNGVEWTPPNQFTNVQDVLSILAFISNATIRPHFTVANLQAISSTDSCVNAFVNTGDVLIAVRAVAGDAYGPPATTKILDPALCPVCP